MRYMESSNANIRCPTDAVSFCYVFAVQPYGSSSSIIDGAKANMLLVNGLDVGLDAESAFTFAEIFGPENGILFLEAGNAFGSFRNATIHGETAKLVVMAQIFDAAIEATFYVNNSEWTQFDCDYHSQCQGTILYVNHDSFDISSDDIIPDSLCIACSSFYDASCLGMKLFVTDTVNNAMYQFDATKISDTWYWTNDAEDIMVTMANAGDGMGADNDCSEVTEEKLGGSWYEGVEDQSCNGATNGGSSSGSDGDNGPEECNWIYAATYSPPMGEDFCFTQLIEDDQVVSYNTICDGGTPRVKVYWNVTDCSSDGQYWNDGNIAGECGYDICGYATYKYRLYDNENVTSVTCAEENYVGVARGAVITNECYGNGLMYTCEEGNKLRFSVYENDDCTGDVIDLEEEYDLYGLLAEGECVGNYFIEELDCEYATVVPGDGDGVLLYKVACNVLLGFVSFVFIFL